MAGSVNKPSLLSAEERDSVRGQHNFVTDYLAWAASKMNAVNPAYNEINAWMSLSIAYADVGFIPYQSGAGELVLYTLTAGQTTSGKSASLKLLDALVSEIHRRDPEFDIGGDASPQALGDKLAERDGRISWFHKDEAHGMFKQLADPKYMPGMLEALAEMYDGKQPPILRKSGNTAKARVRMPLWLAGTPEQLTTVLTKDLFSSGFLARFLWAVGNPRNVTPESVKAKYGVVAEEGIDPWIAARSHDITNTRKLMRRGQGRSPVNFAAVAERADKGAWDIVQLVGEDHPNYDILNPSLVRLGETIRRCAALLALSRGETVVSMDDYLYALTHAETWAENLIKMASQIAASEFEQACNEIESYLAGMNDKRASKPSTYNRFRAIPVADFERSLYALIEQGRVRYFNEGKTQYYGINTNEPA